MFQQKPNYIWENDFKRDVIAILKSSTMYLKSGVLNSLVLKSVILNNFLMYRWNDIAEYCFRICGVHDMKAMSSPKDNKQKETVLKSDSPMVNIQDLQEMHTTHAIHITQSSQALLDRRPEKNCQNSSIKDQALNRPFLSEMPYSPTSSETSSPNSLLAGSIDPSNLSVEYVIDFTIENDKSPETSAETPIDYPIDFFNYYSTSKHTAPSYIDNSNTGLPSQDKKIYPNQHGLPSSNELHHPNRQPILEEPSSINGTHKEMHKDLKSYVNIYMNSAINILKWILNLYRVKICTAVDSADRFICYLYYYFRQFYLNHAFMKNIGGFRKNLKHFVNQIYIKASRIQIVELQERTFLFLKQYCSIIAGLSFFYWFISTQTFHLLPRKFYHPVQESIGFMQVERDENPQGWMPLAQRYIGPQGLPTGIGYIDAERRKMLQFISQAPSEEILKKYGDRNWYKKSRRK